METRPDINSLIQSCRNEELGAVKKMVEVDGIDVNASAVYHFYSPLLGGDFPLFAAAENCNFQLIKYLIAKGANVNSRTSVQNQHRIHAGMTPLQAAVSLRNDIGSLKRRAAIELLVSSGADTSALNTNGNPMWELCREDQPDVTLLLMELGMSVTQKSRETGLTMLHRWAASTNPAAASIIQLILAKGADLKAVNEQGIFPLYVATVGLTCNESRKSPYHNPNDNVLRLLLQREEYSLTEKINTLELAGAKLLLHKQDESSISQAFQYWNEALDLRDSAQGSIPKVPLNSNNIVHWRAVEWTTRDQLRELQNHPSVDRKKIQATLVAQRILSRISSEALLSYLWYGSTALYSGALYSRNLNAELLEVSWILMEGARIHDIRKTELRQVIEYITKDVLKALTKLQIDRNPIFNSETVALSLELVIDTDASHLSEDMSVTIFYHGNHIENMSVIYNLVSMISKSPDITITPEIESCLRRFVHRDGRNKLGNNLLLIACNRKPILDILPLVRLLLDVGADPNSKNPEGNSPLHLTAYWMGDESESPLADLLLEFEADPDQVNLKKETPLDVWKMKHAGPGDGPFIPPTWTMETVPSLVLLSARSVQGSKTLITHGDVPETLRVTVMKD